MKVTAQQKIMLQHMSQQSGYKDFKEMATATGIPSNSFRTQLGRLKDEGLVESENEENINWTITTAGLEFLKGAEAVISREEVGLTPYQLFMQIGRAIGGIPPERLQVITDIVWSTDPENLTDVWHHLSSANVPVDVRRLWFEGWRAYLKTGGKPHEIPEGIKAEVTSPELRTVEQKQEMADQGRDYKIFNGQVIRLGDGIGDYTIKDAKEILAIQTIIQAQGASAEVSAEAKSVAKDTVSSILTALGPYLNKETGDNSALVKELLQTQMNLMSEQLMARIPAQVQAKTAGDQVTGVIAILKSLNEAGPLLRGVLGLPEPGAVATGQAAQTPISIQNPDGTPMVMNLTDFFTIQKFQADQKREEESSKGKQEFLGTVRGFVESIGKAAERAAGAK